MLGKQLVRSKTVAKLVAFAGAALLCACVEEKNPAPPAAGPPVPRVAAQVFSIHTNILPEKKAFKHLVIVGERKVRLGDETEHWRLFDLEKKSVTFVDDLQRTYRTVGLDRLVREHQRLVGTPLPYGTPRARFTTTTVERDLFGVPSTQHVIELGGYRREIWLSRKPLIDESFFPMLIASEPLSATYAGVMRDVSSELLSLRGFPVLDRSDMPYDGQMWTIERRLEKVDKRKVPVSWLTIPAGYRDLAAPSGSGAGRRSASSPLPDRKAPATE